ncbi:Carbonic anhydrase, alpha-class [Trema orientale]|uniref:Carbonic anhydrase n=1 Tax=Trema orientale TaxID=63057 RepID=A0A2P5FVI4_TREOI|nr:Carbonic anhydrase, alpha-class [Trema orientale]
MAKNQSKPILTSWFLLIFLSFYLHQAPISAQEVEDEREFDYARDSEKGPQRWGELKKEWRACKHGKLQSPIDLLDHRVKVLPKFGELKMNYEPANATMMNRGHDIAIKWLGNAGSVKINGTDYFLKQYHWHTPSEHTINGRRFDLELHMVHQSHEVNKESKIAVIALFYKIGKPDPFLSKLARDLISIIDIKKEVHLGLVDPRDLRIKGLKYYRYLGSLTVPPCTEGVLWAINKRINTVSKQQVRLLKLAVHDYAEINARPLQPLNGRDIHLFSSKLRPGDPKD